MRRHMEPQVFAAMKTMDTPLAHTGVLASTFLIGLPPLNREIVRSTLAVQRTTISNILLLLALLMLYVELPSRDCIADSHDSNPTIYLFAFLLRDRHPVDSMGLVVHQARLDDDLSFK